MSSEILSRADHPFTIAVRLLGRDLMDLVEKCFDADTALPRALQETLSGEEIAAIRIWQAWAFEKHGGPSDDGATPLIDPDLPRSNEKC